MNIFRDAPIIVWAVTVFHLVVAAFLLSSPDAGQSTGPAEVVQLLGREGAAIAMIAASVLALAAILRRRWIGWKQLILLLPQQALLYLAAWGGIDAVIEGRYADGVTRPYEFIVTDQLPMIIFAFVHTLAMFELPWLDRTAPALIRERDEKLTSRQSD